MHWTFSYASGKLTQIKNISGNCLVEEKSLTFFRYFEVITRDANFMCWKLPFYLIKHLIKTHGIFAQIFEFNLSYTYKITVFWGFSPTNYGGDRWERLCNCWKCSRQSSSELVHPQFLLNLEHSSFREDWKFLLFQSKFSKSEIRRFLPKFPGTSQQQLLVYLYSAIISELCDPIFAFEFNGQYVTT